MESVGVKVEEAFAAFNEAQKAYVKELLWANAIDISPDLYGQVFCLSCSNQAEYKLFCLLSKNGEIVLPAGYSDWSICIMLSNNYACPD